MKTDGDVTIPNDELHRYAGRPKSYIARYVRRHAIAHTVVFGFVILAVGCAVFSSYGIRHLVDTMDAYNRVHPIATAGSPAVAGAAGAAGSSVAPSADTASTAGSFAAVWKAVIILALLIAADNLSWRVAGWFAARSFVEVTGDVRRDLFRYLSGHSSSYFADRMPTALAARISTAGVATFTLESLLAWNVLPPCLNVLLSIALMLTVSPFMGTVLIVLAAALAGVMFRMASAGRGLHADYATRAAEVDGEMLDVVGNIPLVRTFGMIGHERRRLASIMRHEMASRGRSLIYMEKLRLVHAVLTAVLTAGVLIWVVLLWHAGQATVGDVVMVVNLGFMILHGTRDLAVALVETIQHTARLGETLTSILVPHEMIDRPDATDFPNPSRGEVEFRDVTFAYPGGPNVLERFNLRVEAGTRVGLVGRSGSGKSTVLALLQRQRYVQGGAVVIDGSDLRGLTDLALRGCMSVVPQEVSLLRRSVMENIRYGRPDASDDDVRAAAANAGCSDFILAMPKGFETEVGDRGVKLSGGQRQRLAIARAFLRDAPILILDEATSALDSESEHHIQIALSRLMEGRTVIAVAHRLSTLQDFDRIVVMQTGKIVEDGAPSDLERRSGPYREFLERQAMAIDPID